MKWDLFDRRRKVRRGDANDPVDILIHGIERFAPKKYQSQREVFYYNYRMLGPYNTPLLSLLETLSQRQRLEDSQALFMQDVFMKLKAFYDPKRRLSVGQAAVDLGLQKKFSEVFLFFYDRKDLSMAHLEGWLKRMDTPSLAE
jgi:hypothetical protein